MNLEHLPIVRSLMDYRDENTVPFHMPGHKKGKIYKKAGIDFLDNDILSLDTTEVPGVDNLHCPESTVMEAQMLAAKAFGSAQCFFLVNGTTAGIYSMILAVTEPGDKIIIPRNCHRSVYGAAILGRLTPVYLNPEIDDELGIPMGIKPESIEYILKKHPDAKAVVLTNPTYYGVCSDLERIAGIVHRHGKVLLVDEAHGAHFGFNGRLPKSAMAAGADMAAQSIHKTLLSMTQSSMLQVKSERVDIDKLKFFLQLTQTTSPSHVLLATLDLARDVMERKGKALLDESIDYSCEAREAINRIDGLYCLGRDRIGRYGTYDIDPTRLTVYFGALGLSGSEADRRLRNTFKIQVEMSDLYNIVAITTVGDEHTDYNRFVQALKVIADGACKAKHPEERIKAVFMAPELACMPWEAVYRMKERIRTEDSIGRICGEMVIPYPPGIPVLMPGEVITREILDYVKRCSAGGTRISGTADMTLQYMTVLK